MTAHPDLPSGTSTLFPKAFLLGVYTAAIENGYLWITPLRQADAASLKGKLHRLRRRSDAANKSFITPAHLLVSFGDWEPGPDGRGRMLACYDKAPPELGELPSLLLPSGVLAPTTDESLRQGVQPTTATAMPEDIPLPVAGVAPITAEELTMDAASIDDFVSRMQRNSAARAEDDDV